MDSAEETGLLDVWDPISNTWDDSKAVPTILKRSSRIQLVVVNGDLVVLGGHEREGFAERYDADADRWHVHDPMEPPLHLGGDVFFGDVLPTGRRLFPSICVAVDRRGAGAREEAADGAAEARGGDGDDLLNQIVANVVGGK